VNPLDIIEREDGRKLIHFSKETLVSIKNYLKKDSEGRTIISLNNFASGNFNAKFREAHLDDLIGLEIVNLMIFSSYKNIDGLYTLKELRELDAGGLDQALNFKYFEKLEKLEYYYKPKTQHLFDRPLLSNLRLNKYHTAHLHLEEMASLKNLKELFIAFTNIKSLKGLQNLKKITSLTLAYAPNLVIKQTENFKSLKNVEELRIVKCKNVTMDFVKVFPNLKKLRIENWGKMDTIKPILDNLPKLEYLFIGSGSVINEIDNRYFANYKSIKKFFFEQRRYHMLKLNDLGKWP